MTRTLAVQKHDTERSPEWSARRDAFIRRHPCCAVCGKGQADGISVQAHHIFPFHYCVALGRPELELDERNLITLCESGHGHPAENHHLLLGHLDDFESSNLDVLRATRSFLNLGAAQIRNNAEWLEQRRHRLPHLSKMSEADQAAFRWAMNTRYPDPRHPPGAAPAVLPPWLPR